MKSIFVFIVFNLCTLSSWALAPMEQHLMSASQGMSAFYMHMLSNGDGEYLKQFNKYQVSADVSMGGVSNSEYAELSNTWRTLKHDLKFRYDQGEAVYFSGAIRIEYRNYLTSVYLRFKNSPSSNNRSELSAIARIKVLSTMLAARALDLVSSDYGITDMTEHHRKFNPVEVADIINQDIQFLLARNSTVIEHGILRKIDNKFNFIRKNLVDTKSQTAYFLIYRNMLSMSKILNKY